MGTLEFITGITEHPVDYLVLCSILDNQSWLQLYRRTDGLIQLGITYARDINDTERLVQLDVINRAMIKAEDYLIRNCNYLLSRYERNCVYRKGERIFLKHIRDNFPRSKKRKKWYHFFIF